MPLWISAWVIDYTRFVRFAKVVNLDEAVHVVECACGPEQFRFEYFEHKWTRPLVVVRRTQHPVYFSDWEGLKLMYFLIMCQSELLLHFEKINDF